MPIKVFVKKILLFAIPIIVIVLLPFIFFYNCKEFVPGEKIMEAQLKNEPILIGKSLPFVTGEFSKLDIIKNKKPNIITLGNSRVLQFRSKFFNDRTSFFNGGGIADLNNYKKKIENLSDDELPEIIILGLEQSYFSTQYDKEETSDLTKEDFNDDVKKRYLASWRQFYFNIFLGKYSLVDLFSFRKDGVSRIGIIANVKNSGQRNDGSYYYGDSSIGPSDPKSEDYKFKDTFRRIEKGSNLFPRGREVSEKSIETLFEFLDYCFNKNIYVIGFLPPYAQEVYDKIGSDGGYQYVFELNKELLPVFAKYNFTIFDFSDMKSFGAEKEEIIDGIHASEKAYLRLFIKMVKNDKRLSEYVDLEFLENKLRNEKDNYDVFGIE